jgi:glycosyltransferase involved in cell wall biosynthesis
MLVGEVPRWYLIEMLMPSRPTFTIITATYNAGRALARTADSLRRQSFLAFEWIIIDGASADGTASTVADFGSLAINFVSEPDTGIYNALNKGLDRIQGQWVLILGAGDELDAADTLARAAPVLGAQPSTITTVYGSVAVHDQRSGGVLRYWDRTWEGLDGPWGAGRPKLPCHQGVFQRAELFEKGFRFDERCRISADNEILLRELIAERARKIDLLVARFEVGGASSDPSNRLRMVSESVFINWKLGIFRRRPVYQLAVLAVNVLRHLFRKVLNV